MVDLFALPVASAHADNSLGDAWISCLRQVMTTGAELHDDGRALTEITNFMTVIASVDEADPVVRKFADPDRIQLMHAKYSSCGIVPPYPISYGKLLYANHGVDQVDWVVNRLRDKPETKSATIGMHTPGDSELSCLSLLDFKLRDSGLMMTAVYRSQDVLKSQPGNVLALRTVQEDIATRLGVEVGPFVLHAMSAHVYADDYAQARSILLEAGGPEV